MTKPNRLRLIAVSLVLWWAGPGCSSSPPPDKTTSPPDKATSTATQGRDDAKAPPVPVQGDQVSASTPGAASSDACADCHPEQVESYLKTGMGRSLYAVNRAPVIENFDREVATVKHPAMKASYRAYRDDAGRWYQEELIPGTDYKRTVEVKYVIGSGNHSRSYLGVENGELVQLPLTWYSRLGIWDMSPGYERAGHLRFLRPVVPECLYCHNSLSASKPFTESGYMMPLKEGIGCERCHGDGTAHVEARMSGKVPPKGQDDPWILNPSNLPAERAEQVCQQCHFQGLVRLLQPGKTWSEYDPKEPLNEYLTVYGFADRNSHFEVASHGERLRESKCRNADGSHLRCVSCHQPHGKTTVNVRTVCNDCHTDDRCPNPESLDTNIQCAKCHMPKGGVSDVPHVEFTDHRITRRKRPPGFVAHKPDILKRRMKALTQTSGDPDDEAMRLARADVRHAAQGRGAQLRLAPTVTALSQLLEKSPEDALAWEELAMGLMNLFRPDLAVKAWAEYAKRAPQKVRFREHYAQTLLETGQFERARAVLKDGLSIHPDFAIGWGLYGVALGQLGQFEAARAALERAAKMLPNDSTVAFSLGMNAFMSGRPQVAFGHWEHALVLDPLNAQAAIEVARFLRINRRLPEAKKRLSAILALRPDAREIHLELARIAIQEGRVEDAHTHFDEERIRDARTIATYVEQAYLYVSQNEEDGARAIIESGRRAVPDFPNWDQIKGQVFEERPSAPPNRPRSRR